MMKVYASHYKKLMLPHRTRKKQLVDKVMAAQLSHEPPIDALFAEATSQLLEDYADGDPKFLEALTREVAKADEKARGSAHELQEEIHKTLMKLLSLEELELLNSLWESRVGRSLLTNMSFIEDTLLKLKAEWVQKLMDPVTKAMEHLQQ